MKISLTTQTGRRQLIGPVRFPMTVASTRPVL